MRFKLYFDRDKFKNFFVLKYEDGEWEQIRNKLEQIGLKMKRTTNLWGKGVCADFYKEENEELKKMVENCESSNLESVNFIDDINSPFYEEGRLNIAVFRVVPVNNEIKIEVDSFLTIKDFRIIISGIKATFKMLFNIVTDKEVEIKIIKKEVDNYVSDSNM